MAKNRVIICLNEALGIKTDKKKPLPTYTDMEKGVIHKVVEKLKNGDSQLKHLLERGYTIYQVIGAIKNRKCIANLGSTYFEQTLAGCIRDLIRDKRLQPGLIDQYRIIFGLPVRKKRNAKSHRPKADIGGDLPASAAQKLGRALGIKHGKRSSRIGEPG